ncbi:MAG: DNA alkylation repair protein [bacterium]
MNTKEIISQLKKLGTERNREGMARFGIDSKSALGVSMPIIRKFGKEIGTNPKLAINLWDTKVHEARILSCLINDPKTLTEKEMDKYANDFYSWDLCDQCCMNLFDKTPYAYKKAVEWSKDKKDFVKRAGFALMASLAVHDKKASDSKLAKFFPYIINGSTDERNFVKKAVNWALCQIGKRNMVLNKKAVATAREILKLNSPAAKWIANDAIRELTDPVQLMRIRNKNSNSSSLRVF